VNAAALHARVTRGTSWPSCTVLRFARVDARTAAVHVRVRHWFRTFELELRLLRNDCDGWFWVDTGVPLQLAQGYVWKGLYNALGIAP
jgi:hypothetical protein